MISFLLSLCLVGTWAYAPLREPNGFDNEPYLQDAIERMNRDMTVDQGGYFDLGSKMDDIGSFLPGRATKDAEFMDGDYDMMLGSSGHPSIRDQEYLQHSSLYGHKYITGGNIEGPKGESKLQKEVKSDSVLPAYCNPPNPCPVGFTSDDGCLEVFENSAAFSRAYQASQDCMCDTEHMFDCPAPRDSNDKDEDAEEQQNFLDNLQFTGEHKSLVAKKFYTKKSHDQQLTRLNELAHQAAVFYNEVKPENPFLEGEKLPIAAKKGQHAHH